MELLHYSDTPLKEVYNAPYQVEGRKPVGLWFSTNKDDGWRSWCKSQDFRQDCFNYKTTIKFKPDAKILQLTNKQAVKKFWQKYGKPTGTGGYAWEKNALDWSQITKKYDAIYMPEYYNELRKQYYWYDAWDCSSGCVWNADAIDRIETVPVEKYPEGEPNDAHIKTFNDYCLAA